MQRYSAPLEVHVTWPAISSPRPETLALADRIQRRLGRWVPPGEPDTAIDDERGAGIPVFLGTPTETLETAGSSETTQIIVGLLDCDAFESRDERFEGLLKQRSAVIVALDDRFEKRFPGQDVLRPERVMDALVHRVNRALKGPSRIALVVDDSLEHRGLEKALMGRVIDRGLDALFTRPQGDSATALRECSSSSVFVQVRRDASPTEREPSVILIAKELKVPVVTALCQTSGEDREAAYAGNAPAVVVDPKSHESVDRLVDECTRAWLSHLHFHVDAERIRNFAGLPLDTIILSRPPELVDFATGSLPSFAAVVLYPDPPLPSDEARIMRRQHPEVRFVTPTTVHTQILGPSATPPLDGMRVALSLSKSPELPELVLGAAPQWRGSRHSRGLTERHYRDLVEHLTLCLIRSGAELAYGGYPRRGHTLSLSRLVERHRQLQLGTEELLHVYTTPGNSRGDSPRLDAAFHRLDTASTHEERDVANALDYSAMRQKMAKECHARVLLGGKTLPVLRCNGEVVDHSGYSGRFPGQAEEAWFALYHEVPKPVYVIGAFGGASELVGKAMRGEFDFLPADTGNPDHLGFIARVDAVRKGGPRSLEAMWHDFAEYGKELVESRSGPRGSPDHLATMCSNGLTVEENETLFRSTQIPEIAALVMRGLFRKARDPSITTPLTLLPFHGPIEDSPAVHVYVVPVVDGLPMSGADRALDRATNGALAAHRKQLSPGTFAKPGSIELVGVADRPLPGKWIALLSLGTRESIRHDALSIAARELGECVGRKAVEQGWTEIATVPMGGNLSLVEDVSTRVKEFVQGIRAVDGLRTKSLVICEIDNQKYEQVKSACLELAETEGVHTKAIPSSPVPIRTSSVSTVLTVNREGNELKCKLIPPRGATVLPVHSHPLAGWVAELVNGASLPIESADVLAALREQVREAILSPRTQEQLREWVQYPIRIAHDQDSASLPFELALSVSLDGGAEYTFAFEAGVSRQLQTTTEHAPRYALEPTRGRLRVLLVVDPTEDLPRAKEEAERLVTDLRLRNVDVVASLVGGDASVDSIRHVLTKERVDILHYSGHATPNGLHLKNDTLTADAFAEAKFTPSLVVLNACQSAVVGPENTKEPSLANAILLSGVRCFIGTGWRVPDAVAARFGRRFLRYVADSLSIGTAFARTMSEMRHDDYDPYYWFYYRLYGDADFVYRL